MLTECEKTQRMEQLKKLKTVLCKTTQTVLVILGRYMTTITLYKDKLNGVGGLFDNIIKSSNNLGTQLER